MSNSKINVATINATTLATIERWDNNLYKLDCLAKQYKSDKTQAEKELEDAKNARTEGKVDSIVEQLNAITKLENKYKEDKKPLNDDNKECYKLIPATIFEAYEKYITEGKKGDFMKSISEFLINCGVEGAEDSNCSGIRKLTEVWAIKLGSKKASYKDTLKNGNYTKTMGKYQFSDMFLRVFIELLINKGAWNK